ncbi:hypothetical protein F511_10702 [Dorcoceras hygrometricum]|uniref:Uncharacterized protein n=1 Tax=Dorcoceras hygrometricum TaxID=472368 RepID=A0A2Z7CTD8_9LAMI|nr:hypothetical protein F511_10702 [Dorcoceras hygrometricum]
MAAEMEARAAAAKAKRLEAMRSKDEVVADPSVKQKWTIVGRAPPSVKAFTIIPAVVEAIPVTPIPMGINGVELIE